MSVNKCVQIQARKHIFPKLLQEVRDGNENSAFIDC